MSASSFARLLSEALSNKQKWPTQRALAEAIQVKPQTISRVKKGGGRFNALGCLRFALVTGLHPNDVLHAAGLHDVAELLSLLYGPSSLTPELKRLIAAYDRSSDEAQHLVRSFLQIVPPRAGAPPAATAGRGGPTHAARRSRKRSTGDH